MIKSIDRLIARKKILVLLLIILFSIGSLCSHYLLKIGMFDPGIAYRYQHYEGEKYPIAFDYPENWKAHETPSGSHGDQEIVAYAYFPRNVNSYFFVAQKEFIDGNSDDVLKWAISRKTVNAENVQTSEIKTEHYEGIRITYETTSIDLPIFGKLRTQYNVVVFFVNGTGYMLTFYASKESWESLEETRKRIFDSFLVTQ